MGRRAVSSRGFSRHSARTGRDTLESKAVRRRRLNSTLKSLLFWIVLIVVGIMIWNFSTTFQRGPNPMSFTDFLQHVENRQVVSVVITGQQITGKLDGTTGTAGEFRT